MSVVHVKIPATTANVGPGFDCLGIALQVYNVVTVRSGAGSPPHPMVQEAAEVFFKAAKKKSTPFQWEIRGDVPRSRGLGSSVIVRLGILHGLNGLAGCPLNREALYEICADLEGHPDNAAPAAFGGFTIARSDKSLQRYRIKNTLGFALLIPDFEVATPDARKVMPKTIPLKDAVISASNASAIAGAFASGNYEKLKGCFEDRLHQPYREKLVPFLSKTIRAGEKAGALGGWLSGSGSTIACATLGNIEVVARAMRKASGQKHILAIRADNHGVRVKLA